MRYGQSGCTDDRRGSFGWPLSVAANGPNMAITTGHYPLALSLTDSRFLSPLFDMLFKTNSFTVFKTFHLWTRSFIIFLMFIAVSQTSILHPRRKPWEPFLELFTSSVRALFIRSLSFTESVREPLLQGNSSQMPLLFEESSSWSFAV